MQNRALFCRFETNQARRTSKENGNGRSACLVLRERRKYGILKPQRRIAGRACGWRFAGDKNNRSKADGPQPGRNGDTRDLRLEKNAARRAACQLRARQSGSQLERRSKGACGWRLFCRRQKNDAGAKRTLLRRGAEGGTRTHTVSLPNGF